MAATFPRHWFCALGFILLLESLLERTPTEERSVNVSNPTMPNRIAPADPTRWEKRVSLGKNGKKRGETRMAL
jgi:hypothetical protein